VYSGNDYVKMLLADFAIQVVSPTFLDRLQFNATKIRSMIISDDNWQNLVPPAVVEYLEKINAKKRLDIISKSDTKPTEH
jgi:nicotinamide-nucleotide adenylyltransferase